MMTLLDVLGKIAWVRSDFLSQGKISDILIPCARKALSNPFKVSKGAKIRDRYNQVPHLNQDTNGKVTNSQQTPQTRAKRSALTQQVTTKHI